MSKVKTDHQADSQKKYALVQHLFTAAVAFFFFLMLIFPTTFQFQRSFMLLALVAGGGVAAVSGRWRISQDIFFIWLFSIILGILGIFWGVIHNAPGALWVTTVFIVWPGLYMLFIGLVHSKRTIVVFEKIIAFGVMVSSLMLVVLLVGAVTGHGQFANDLFGFLGMRIGLYSGHIELSSNNIATVIYGLPFLVSIFFMPATHGWVRHRWKIGCLLLPVLLVCIVSGRRAFWMLALVTPMIVGGIFLLSRIRFRLRYLLISLGLIAVVSILGATFLDLSFQDIVAKFRSGFDFNGELSASLRAQQFEALMLGWSESPIFGHGLGASTVASIRSEEMPWAYELSYVALLFQAGLFGSIGYSIAVFWVFYSGIKIVRSQPAAAPIILPLLAGLAGFLLVNATNPYLAKFDYLWTIFLPVAAINAYRTSKR